MLSRPLPTTATDRLVKATLLATLATLGIHGGLFLAAHRTADTCAIATDGLDAQGTLFVVQRVLACRDYEHGQITKDEYHRAIGVIDVTDVRAPVAAPRVMWAS